MTTAAMPVPATHYRVKHVIKSEVMKVMTLPSTAITVGVTVVLSLLVTALVAHAALHHGPGFYIGFDPTQETLTGMIVAGLTAGVFGALLITGEYASGTVRASLAATPKRPVLLAAKLVVTAAITVAFFELLSFATFFLGQAILHSGGAPSVSLGSTGALRAVTLTGLFVSLLALMSFGWGLICRSTAAAIGAFVGVVFVLPLVMRGISEHLLRYVPTNILVNSIMSTIHQGPGGIDQPVTPAVGLLLMTLYAVLVVGVGTVLFMKRDA
jgi:ABC-2 type transport system permease protein